MIVNVVVVVYIVKWSDVSNIYIYACCVFLKRNRRRRAKALLDFERHDDDELGFRKNDIITVSNLFLHV
jgi:hypothetical protein